MPRHSNCLGAYGPAAAQLAVFRSARKMTLTTTSPLNNTPSLFAILSLLRLFAHEVSIWYDSLLQHYSRASVQDYSTAEGFVRVSQDNTTTMSVRCAIDVVDLDPFLNGSSKQSVGDAIVKSFKDTGFVYLVNHGLEKEKIDRMFQWVSYV